MMLTKEEKMVRWLYLNPFIQHKEIELTIECHDVNKVSLYLCIYIYMHYLVEVKNYINIYLI